MPKCCVPYCENTSANKKLTFHEFPHGTPLFLNTWLKKIGRANWKPGLRSVVCSDHFVKSDFLRNGSLHFGSIPTVFPEIPIKRKKKDVSGTCHQENKHKKCDTDLEHNLVLKHEPHQEDETFQQHTAHQEYNEYDTFQLHEASVEHKAAQKHDTTQKHNMNQKHNATQKHKASQEHKVSQEHKATRVYKVTQKQKVTREHEASQEHQPTQELETDIISQTIPLMSSFSLLACRVCGHICSSNIGIFTEEGKKAKLQHLIHKNLPIKVAPQDSLPLQLCLSCISHLESFQELINISKKTNDFFMGKCPVMDPQGRLQKDLPIIRPQEHKQTSNNSVKHEPASHCVSTLAVDKGVEKAMEVVTSREKVGTQYTCTRRVLLLELPGGEQLPIKKALKYAINDLTCRIRPKESHQSSPLGKMMVVKLHSERASYIDQMKIALDLFFPKVTTQEKTVEGHEAAKPKEFLTISSPSSYQPFYGSKQQSSCLRSVGSLRQTLPALLPKPVLQATASSHHTSPMREAMSTASIQLNSEPCTVTSSSSQKLIQLHHTALAQYSVDAVSCSDPLSTKQDHQIQSTRTSFPPLSQLEENMLIGNSPGDLLDTNPSSQVQTKIRDLKVNGRNAGSSTRLKTVLGPHMKKLLKLKTDEDDKFKLSSVSSSEVSGLMTKLGNGSQFKLGDKIIGIVVRGNQSTEKIKKKLQASFNEKKNASELDKQPNSIPSEPVMVDLAEKIRQKLKTTFEKGNKTAVGVKKIKLGKKDLGTKSCDAHHEILEEAPGEQTTVNKNPVPMLPKFSNAWNKRSFLASSLQQMFFWKLSQDTHSESMQLVCRVCSLPMQNQKESESHLFTHSDLQCSGCHQFFLTTEKMKDHFKATHSQQDIVCDKKIRQNYSKQLKTKLIQWFQCSACDKRFKLREMLKRHQLVHKKKELEPPKPTCPLCGRKAESEAGLQEHMLVHSKREANLCDICGEVFKCWSAFQQHRARTHADQFSHFTHQCTMCRKLFKNLDKLHVHMDKHEQQKNLTFVCTVCGKVFGTLNNLKRHEIWHLEPQFQCGFCSLRFHRRDHLRQHEARHNSGLRKKQYNCLMCMEVGNERVTFPSMKNLLHHYYNDHGQKRGSLSGRGIFSCNQCARVFHNSTVFRHHKLWHAGKRPYNCATCGMGFMSSDRMRNHERLHTNERPYKCKICGKGFRCRTVQMQHMEVHLDSSLRFKCSFCDKTFHRKENYVLHTRIHTREKPWKCLLCSAGFRVKGDCNKHICTVHKRPVEDIPKYQRFQNENSSSDPETDISAHIGIDNETQVEKLSFEGEGLPDFVSLDV